MKEFKQKEIEENQKNTKKKMIIQYLIPLILLIIVAIIYIPTQKNILLIPFAILMLIVLFGHDASSRSCPHCKKWNSVIWEKTEKKTKNIPVTKKNILGKKKDTEVKRKYVVNTGKCRNCGYTFEKEQERII